MPVLLEPCIHSTEWVPTTVSLIRSTLLSVGSEFNVLWLVVWLANIRVAAGSEAGITIS